jgi:hypothetical protein
MSRKILVNCLFIIGGQDTGKSSTLRSLFKDHRLGREGTIPTEKKIEEIISLGPTTSLILRLTSPHEYNESSSEFFRKIKKNITPNKSWSFAAPLQPYSFKKMPNLIETINRFQKHFYAHKIIIAFLDPDRHGNSDRNIVNLINDLHSHTNVYCLRIDATIKYRNAFLLSQLLTFG